MDEAINELDRQWDSESGFFGQLRNGIYTDSGFQKVVSILASIDLGSSDTISRRLVSLLWFMPLFMGWQKNRVLENGGDSIKLDNAIGTIENLLESILGVP